MKRTRWLIPVLLLGCTAMWSCDDGPMEEAGERVDEAVEDVGEAVDDAVDDVEDAVDDEPR